MSAIETKLAAARTRLILDKPFLGALVLRLPLVEAEPAWCPTTATDARTFYYNPRYIDGLSLDQTQFVLAHEALHCALSHFARRQHRVQHRWDLACDFAVNPLLVDDGLTPPPNAVIISQYQGMTAEEIYPLLDDSDETETLDRHVYDREQDQGGSGSPAPPPGQDEGDRGKRPGEGGEQERPGGAAPSEGTPESAAPSSGTPQQPSDAGSGAAPRPQPLTPDERETLAVQWQQRTAGAAQQALQAGKLGGELARMIDHLLQPQLPWRMLLARYMSAAARDDFSYMRPSRREGAAILPSLRSAQVDLVVAIDTSGSIKHNEVKEFVAEIQALKGQIRSRITLLACDAELNMGSPWLFEPWEELRLPASLGGGGGTSFRPVFEWVERSGLRPELLVYFTDAKGEFPGREPAYPVIWLIKGREKVPWGQRVQLN